MDQHVDGVSLLPLLKDPAAKLDRDALYWHYPHYSPQGGTPSGAIRVGSWKLIEFFEDGKLELYDLEEDVGETTDLAARMPEEVKGLHEKLLAWRKQVDAKLPRPNPNWVRATP
jgi:arylsulfatase A-like enzyme